MKNIIKISAAMLLVLASLLAVSCSGNTKTEETTATPETEAQTEAQTEEITTEEATTAEETTEAISGQDQLKAILESSPEITAKVKKLINIPAYSTTVKANQGGYTDGTYWYQMQIQKDTVNNEADNICIMRKYELKTGKHVADSENLGTNHSNDILYNAKINRLIVVHNNPNRQNITLVDPDTLKVDKVVTIIPQIYCMTYNEKYDRYVVGLSGGQNFRTLSADFQIDTESKIRKSTTLTTGYTTQGCSSDDNFIYFVLYNQNVVTVYDWSGKFVTLIHFDVGSLEPENISVVDGTIYIGVAQNGMTIYKLIFS